MAQCPSPRLLTQLTTVVLAAEVNMPPDVVDFFMALPSIRSVHAGVLGEELPGSAFPAKSSDVQNVVLYSDLKVDSIVRIIACSRSLSELFIIQCDRDFTGDTPLSIRKFFTTHRGFEDGSAGSEDGSAIQRIFQSISDLASDSLEKLTINCWVDGGVRLETLWQFSNLRYLAFPINLFCQDHSRRAFSIRAYAVNSLPSLEHLRLIDDGELDANEGHLEEVLEEIRSVVDAKDDLTPKLSRLDLHPPLGFFHLESEILWFLVDALRTTCDEKKVEYNVVYFENNWRVAPPSRHLLTIGGNRRI